MSSVIVDASVALKWVVDEEDSDLAVQLADLDLAAPAIFSSECANGLWAKAQRREITPEEAVERLQALMAVPVELVPVEALAEEALLLALSMEHPVYDCFYLALALRRDVLLITADGRFTDAVLRHGEYSGHIRRLANL